MKNQYFGDQTDFIKYGILRSFLSAGFPLVVNWMLTAGDGSNDGRRTAYLRSPLSWRSRDSEVFDLLRAAIERKERQLSVIEGSGLLEGAVFHSDLYTPDASARDKSNECLHSLVGPGSVVFFDPDNGLEVRSVARGRKNSEKYVYLSELEAVWHRDCSILIYQHFPRVNRDLFLEQQASMLKAALNRAQVLSVLTSHVAFLMVPQPGACVRFNNVIGEIIARWWPHAKSTLSQHDPLLAPQLSLGFDRATS